MLIPPSLLLILYGIIAEVSIGDLFTAGIVPGIVLSILFCLAILALTRFAPSFTGTPQHADLPIMSKTAMTMKSAPIIALILLVLGGIYGGFFTPTEAGGVGALGALAIAVVKGRLNWREIGRILLETGQVTASITFLIIAAHMYSRLLALTGLPNAMASLMSAYDLGLYGVLLLYLLAILLLGTILDSSSILLILLPLILPVVLPLGVDVIWFGILTIIAVEVGLLTPPLGVACFVIKANLDDDRITLNDIFAGAAPLAIIMVIMVGLIMAMPWLAVGIL
jgi:tripartite ATP-independent transporter DctM subunit